MDFSREADINQLTMVIHNPDESADHKRRAIRALERIKSKMRDPFLKSQRLRLIKAQQAADVAEQEKISNLISDYELSTYGPGR